MSAEVILVCAIFFIAALTRATLGFGDALVAMPLLALVIGIRSATPLMAFAAPTIGAAILLRTWRAVDYRVTLHLILATTAGIPLGLYLFKYTPPKLIKAGLGVLLVGFALYKGFAPELPPLTRRRYAWLAGFLAGILGAAYNTNGPPVIIYGTLRRWSPERFRATLQGYFLPAGLLVLAGHGLAGLWTPQLLHFYLWSLPLMLLAVALGSRLNTRLSGKGFDRAVYAGLLILGVFLIVLP